MSCLLAVRDEIDQIEDCVRSVRASEYPHLELIVVDDAPTDGTTAHLRRLSAELGFRLVTLETNVGKKAALTTAARLARGSALVLAWLLPYSALTIR